MLSRSGDEPSSSKHSSPTTNLWSTSSHFSRALSSLRPLKPVPRD